MPPPYQAQHWNTFVDIPHMNQGPVGDPPARWADKWKIANVPDAADLPNFKLNRQAVRRFCTNPQTDVLFGYVCAMAWGGQGRELSGRRNVSAAWNASATLSQHLTALRIGNLSRKDAFNLFNGITAIPGLGPAFFTKLLYFFSPTPSFYVMDQWTAKSVNLLTGRWVVPMQGDAVLRSAPKGCYQAFCEEVDLMAGLLGCAGHIAEQRLFSEGGNYPWPWRAYVDQEWTAAMPANRYSATAMAQAYPHIPAVEF